MQNSKNFDRLISIKKVFLKISQNSREDTCIWASFLASNFIKKGTLAQVFSCEFCKIFKNTFTAEHPPLDDCFW